MANNDLAEVRITGDDAIIDLLDEFQDPEMRDLLMFEAALVVQDEARRQAPRDTGALSESVYAVSNHHNTYPAAAAGARGSKPEIEVLPMVYVIKRDEAKVASCAEYGAVVEYHGGGVDAFLRPALDESRREIVDAMTNKMIRLYPMMDK